MEEIVNPDADETVKAETREALRAGKFDETAYKNPKFKSTLDGIKMSKCEREYE